jgi:ketosteroid isomerase-like protein
MKLSSEDELAILRVINQYAQAGSCKDIDTLVDLFTEDGVWERRQGATDGKYTEMPRIEGRDAWREFALMSFDMQGDLRYQYIAANVVVAGEKDKATAQSTAYIFGIAPDGAVSIVLIGNFQDELRRTEAGWKFTYRGISLSK